jgi:hypothetical protein
MRDLLFIMVFSIVLLFFAIYPAIRIVDFINSKKNLSEKAYNYYTIAITITIALIGGLFLRYFEI